VPNASVEEDFARAKWTISLLRVNARFVETHEIDYRALRKEITQR
jgi:hypothetical protein